MQEIEIAFAPVGSGEAEPRDEKKQSDKDDERDPLEEAPGSSGAKPRPPKSRSRLLNGWRRPRLTALTGRPRHVAMNKQRSLSR